MNSLRFLLVHRDPQRSDAIAARLARANHTVLPTSGLEEAEDALAVERFDAILMESGLRLSGLEAFSARLRQMEQSQKSAFRMPLIALGETMNGDGLGGGEHLNGHIESYIDAVVPEPLDPEAVTTAVSRLASALTRNPVQTSHSGSSSELVVIDPERFREQVGFDDELMVEIIDLFLTERERQEPEMHAALDAGDFELLSRVAHTIKGSLGSLHAMRARADAQVLELAAKHRDGQVCAESLASLEMHLAELEPVIIALRKL